MSLIKKSSKRLTRDDLMILVAASSTFGKYVNRPQSEIASEILHNNIDRILENEKLREKIEYYAKHPMAMNYATFEAWASDLLREIVLLNNSSEPK